MKWFWQKRIYDNGYAFVAVFADGHKEEYSLYDEAYDALYGRKEEAK